MRTNKLKSKLVVILTAIMLFSVSLSVVSFNSFRASADTSLAQLVTDFNMSDKQQVRYAENEGDPKGMRFVAVLGDDDYSRLQNAGYDKIEYGYFIMPAYYETKIGTINEENTFGASAKYTWDGKAGGQGQYKVLHKSGIVPVLDENGDLSQGDYLVKGSVVDMRPQNLATKYTARMYIKATKGSAVEYKFAVAPTFNSSMIDVAIRAMDNGETDASLQGYVDSYKKWYAEKNGGAKPTYSYTVNYVKGNEIVKTITVENVEINTDVNYTQLADGYVLDSSKNSDLKGKVYADNSLTLTAYVKECITVKGALYNNELYHFERNSDEDAKVEFTNALGKVNTVKIGDVNIANFFYEDSTKTLTISKDVVKTLATGDFDMMIETATDLYSARITVADVIINDVTEFMQLQTSGQPSTAESFNYYILGNDIENVTGYTNTQNASASVYFRGTLDGKGYAVKNLTMGSNSHALFSVMSSSATVKNIAFINVTQQSAHRVAIIANQAFETAVVDNVFISGLTNTNSVIFNTSSDTVKISNTVVDVTCNYEDKKVNPAITRGGAVITNSYVCSNYTGGVGAGAVNCVETTTENALLDAMNKNLPDTFNALWSFDVSGNLKFGDEVVMKYSKTIVGKKTNGELFYFGKDVTNAKGYAGAYVSNDNYNVTLPEDVGTVNAVSIAGASVSGFAYSNKVLSIPVSAISSIASGETTLEIDASTANYKATVTVADSVIYDSSDIVNVWTNETAIGSGKLIVLDRDITWDYASNFAGASKHMYGTLDGKGNAIIGFKANTRIWNTLQSGTVIKNIAMIGANFYASGGLFGGEIGSVTFDNVAVTFDVANCNGLVSSITNKITIKDTIVVCNNTAFNSYGYAGSYSNGKVVTLENAYCVTGHTGAIKNQNASGDTTNIYETAQSTVCADLATLLTKSENLKNFNTNYWKVENGSIYFGGDVVLANG